MISREYVLSRENRARLAPRVSSQLRALLLPYLQSLSGVALLACAYVCVKVKSLSRVRLCDPMDCTLPGSSVHGIFQAIVLEWIAISFFRGSSQPRY